MSVARHGLGFAASVALLALGIWGLLGDAAGARPSSSSRLRGDMVASFAVVDGGDASTPADGGDAATPADGGDAATPADGGDAATPADGGDAAVSADGGDAAVSPLDQNTIGTLVAEYNWIGLTNGPHTPLTPYAGTCGANCNITEFASPNWSGAQSTSPPWTIIKPARTNQAINNNTSGGWGQSAWTGPGTLTFPIVVRALVKTPATFGTKYIWWTTTTANAALWKLSVDATPRFVCAFDDGPGSTVQAVFTGITANTWYHVDCVVDASRKVQICVNPGSCSSQSTAGGATAYAPDTVGVGASNANTSIWDGQLETVQIWHNATGWNTTLTASDYTVMTN